jgi:hypothetical protein
MATALILQLHHTKSNNYGIIYHSGAPSGRSAAGSSC